MQPGEKLSSILFRHVTLVTSDGGNRVFRDGGVLVEDGEIVSVGKSDYVEKNAGRVELVIEGPRRLVMPGLINTHVHPAQSLLRGLVPDNVKLIEWLKDWVWPFQGNFSEKDGLAAARLVALEMLRTGTTSFLATSMNGRYGVDRMTEVFYRAGLRAAIGRQVMDMPDYALAKGVLHPGLIEDKEESIRSFKQLHSRWNGKDNRVWIWLSPRTPGAVSEDLYREIAYLKAEYETGVTMHLAEVKQDIDYFSSLGTTPARFLERLGLLGEKSVFVHCVWFREDDIELFAKTKTSVSHNPSSNMKLGSGTAPIPQMLSRGVNVALGTDGGPSNDSYDMIREMRTAALLHKVASGDPGSLTLMDVIRMATINGARALGIDHIAGSIEQGKRADIVVVDLKKPHLTPTLFAVSNLVYAAVGTDVEHVFIDGVHVVREGRVTTLNEEEILLEAEKRAEELYSRVKGESWISYS